MQPHRKKLLPLLAAASTLLLQACSTLTTGQTNLSGAAIATAIGHVRPSTRDTCETQVQIAAQSSKLATLQRGTETVYKPAPPCDKPQASPAPKVSDAGVAAEHEWHKPLPIEVDSTRARRVAGL